MLVVKIIGILWLLLWLTVPITAEIISENRALKKQHDEENDDGGKE